jgi:hypothetical protein
MIQAFGVFLAHTRLFKMRLMMPEQPGVKARGMTLMQMLVRGGLVTDDMLDLHDNLRIARNAVAHGEANLPNDAEALEYTRQARFLISGILSAANKLKGSKGGGTEKEPPG